MGGKRLRSGIIEWWSSNSFMASTGYGLIGLVSKAKKAHQAYQTVKGAKAIKDLAVAGSKLSETAKQAARAALLHRDAKKAKSELQNRC